MNRAGFLTVKHKDGREAEITESEVAFYGSLGFAPVDGYTPSGERQASAAPPAVQPPTNGTDQRLDLLIAEIQGLRAEFTKAFDSSDVEALELPELQVNFEPVVDELRGLRADLAKASASKPEPHDGETVELRGIGTTSTTTTSAPTTTSTTTTPAPDVVPDMASTLPERRQRNAR